MEEAPWGDAGSPVIDWRVSAALENVPRGSEDVAEVTSLEGAVRAWLALDPDHRGAATLTPERPVMLDGVAMEAFVGDGIGALADRLVGSGSAATREADDAA